MPDAIALPPEPTEADLAEKRERNLKRAASRAKQQCRRFIKTHGFAQMLTLTYRENQEDEALFKEHFAKWVRRMKAALGGVFDYCAGFEPQDRGAWHAHVACHKMPTWVVVNKGKVNAHSVQSWRLGTKVWESVVGEGNGLCFVGGKRRKSKRRSMMSVGQNAAYVSKYITKHYELMPDGKNRYSRSNGEVSKPITMRLTGYSLPDVIAEAFMCFPGEVVLSHRVGRWSDSWYLATEPGGVTRPSSDV